MDHGMIPAPAPVSVFNWSKPRSNWSGEGALLQSTPKGVKTGARTSAPVADRSASGAPHARQAA